MATRTTEKDYLAVAKKKVKRARDFPFIAKMLVYGRKKKGKTTFATSAGVENTLVIDPELGAIYKRKDNPYIWPVNRWEDMQDVWGALRSGLLSPASLELGPSDEPFTWVAVDGLTRVNNMCLKYIMKTEEQKNLDRRPGIVDRRDYNKSGELMKTMLTNFHNLPMGVIYTAQERMISADSGDSDEDEESTFFVADLPDGVRGHVNSLVDVIARLYVVTVEVRGEQKQQRRLQLETHERYDTGYRSDFVLPSMVKYPTIPKVTKLMMEGKVK